LEDIAHIVSKIYSKINYEDLPKNVSKITKMFIMDSIGTSLAGTRAPGCQETVDIFKRIGGNPDSTVIGFNLKLPAFSSALINSMTIHALDFDDTYDLAAMHCYTSVLPTAIALAELKGDVSGKELINAVVLGVDLCARLGAAINTPLSWIRTSTCGSFASVLAACKILKLPKEKILNALGIVYSQTSGNAQCLIDGGLAKRMQPGFAASSGVLSSLMSESGLTGAKEVFEGKYGYFNLYEGGNYNREIVLENLGKEFYGTKISIKPYPSCRMTHASIDAALYLKENYQFEISDIDKIELYTSKMVKDMVGSPFKIRENPQVDAQFSIPYTVSVALIEGKPFIDDFYDDRVRNFKGMNLVKKISVISDEQLARRSISSSFIKLYLKNGQILNHNVNVFKGNPENPLSESEYVEKFKKCANFGIKEFNQNQLTELYEKILNLEKIKYISELTRMLS
jgi:2-methylcitrate dehydratase PrpD